MSKFEGFDPNTITEFQVYELLDDIPEKYQNLNFDYFMKIFFTMLNSRNGFIDDITRLLEQKNILRNEFRFI